MQRILTEEEYQTLVDDQKLAGDLITDLLYHDNHSKKWVTGVHGDAPVSETLQTKVNNYFARHLG